MRKVFFCLLFSVNIAFAQDINVSGNILYSEIKSKNETEFLSGVRYIMGVVDALDYLGLICVPQDVNTIKLVGLVDRYYSNNQDQLNKPASGVLLHEIFIKEFQCGVNNSDAIPSS
jgi:hypothetical protein